MSDKTKKIADNKRIDERFHAVPVKRARVMHDPIPVELPEHEIARVDDWITRQRGSPSRAEAIAILTTQALEAYDLANRTKRR